MRGDYAISPDVTSDTEKFIQHLKMDDCIRTSPPINTYITTDEWKASWKNATECTTSGLDFLHFGHFKAGCTNNVIANFEVTMANILILSGYSPTQW